MIRLKVAYNNGDVRCAAGDTTGDLPHSLMVRMVRSGLAEWAEGNAKVDAVRAKAGLPPVRRRIRRKK